MHRIIRKVKCFVKLVKSFDLFVKSKMSCDVKILILSKSKFNILDLTNANYVLPFSLHTNVHARKKRYFRKNKYLLSQGFDAICDVLRNEKEGLLKFCFKWVYFSKENISVVLQKTVLILRLMISEKET